MSSLQLNRATVAGKGGVAPTIRQTADGTSVANFRIASNEYVGRNTDGSPKFHTEWHSIVAWGPLAENVARRLEKGSAMYVEGALRTRSFEDTNGETRRITEVKASKVQFLDPREIENAWADNDPAVKGLRDECAPLAFCTFAYHVAHERRGEEVIRVQTNACGVARNDLTISKTDVWLI